jgi:molybdopterin synthase catalytic subunit
MRREVIITTDPIDEAAKRAAREASPDMGAVVCFLGLVRALEGNQTVAGLDYEVFTRMAEHQFGRILDQVARRWPVASVRLHHRVGMVPVNEPSLWVEVVAPHRAEAFAACEFVIDEMKRVVPIWKHPVPAGR